MAHLSEIVFIDVGVPDISTILNGLRSEIEVILLHRFVPASRQIANALQDRTDLRAVHVIAHGKSGEVSFSAGAMTLETLLVGETHLHAIGKALRDDGRILLWSCQTGEDSHGDAFVDALSQVCGARVAAARGLIGDKARGGSWVLDAGAGMGTLPPPLVADAIARYAHVMAFNITGASIDAIDSDTGSSSSDFLTNDATLTFRGQITSGTGNGNGILDIYLNLTGSGLGTKIGTTTINGIGAWQYSYAQTLNENNYTINITDENKSTVLSSHSLKIDKTVPTSSIASNIGTNSGLSTTIVSGGLTRDNTLALSGTASDVNGVASVQLFDGVTLLGTPTLATGVWNFTTSSLADGVHSFTTKVTDLAGNVAVTAAVTAQVDTTLPTATISNSIGTNTGLSSTIASGGVTRDGTLELSGTVSDSSGVDSVQVYDSATLLGTAVVTSGAWAFTTALLPDGMHSFNAKAADNAGNTALTGSITVKLDTVAPVITSSDTAFAIAERSGSGQTVYTASSNDAAGTTYSLKAGSDTALTIDIATGAVKLGVNPDFESKSSYTFTVVATDTADNAGEKTVNLAITNIDEVAPTITSGTTAVAIAENSGTGQVVYTATSADTDDIVAGVTYYSLKAGSDTAFTIDAAIGTVKLGLNPDFENKSSYAFTVVATDAAGNASEKAVALALTNIDEVAPTITSGTTATSIAENSGSGHVVYTATSTDTGDIAIGATTYSLKAGSDAAFSIDDANGAVKLGINPDFESKNSYGFTVVATDAAGHASEKAVSLAITNIDEVAPTITSDTAATAIAENSGSGQIVYTATSTDTGDISTNTTAYSLKAGSHIGLGINGVTGAVTLSGNPDFENESGYNFTIVATDTAGNASEKAVSLAITNTDEVAPLITSATTAATVTENSGSGQLVYTATSTDTGDISAGVTTYSLKAGTDPFSIDGSTGAVKLGVSPDYESRNSYSFTIVATDAAGNASEETVSLAVTNIDEAAPTITSGATSTAIAENSGTGQVVYTATSTDSADISTGATAYRIKAGSDSGFSINGATGAVTLSSNPDFEIKDSYSFTVVATDTAGNASEKTVSLAISDMDEVAPTITSGTKATGIAENSGIGQVVYTATSTDTGDISTGATAYSLKASSDAGLGIDGHTGAVTFIGNPDFESKNSYNFTVVATDAAGNNSEKSVSLAVTNIDEAAPVITSGDAATTVAENSGTGQVVYTATSTDTGDISTGATAYRLKAGSDSGFSIDAVTGAVKLGVDPDFESKHSYTFTVVAVDAAGNASEKVIGMVVTNTDESAPVITSSATATAIAENSGSGQMVYTATSTDTDDISTGVTTYSIKTGSDAGFSIDGVTGAVTMSGNPDFESKSRHSFTVVAIDAAGNAGEKAISLPVINMDEVAPVITSGGMAVSIAENSGSGQTIYTATSTDSGDIFTGGSTYSLKAGSDAVFNIDAATGVVKLGVSPDFETKNIYSFTLVATDAAGNASEKAVSLAVTNVDEVAPVITSAAAAAAIAENLGSGRVVYTATSTDTGDISTGTTVYSLKAGSDSGLGIDGATGAVTLSSNPDFESKNSYSFTVVATDAAGNHSENAVTLAVINTDEVAPMITSAGSAATIAENSGSGQIVYTVTSTDTGDISTGATSYSLKAGSDPAFSIDTATGAVRLVLNPDFESTNSYSFTVVATDSAGNADEKVVGMAVTNTDEAAPMITSAATASVVTENSGNGQLVYTATSIDTGDISSGATTYALKAGSDSVFMIDAATGAVKLGVNPDFESKNSYSFTVVATDTAGNAGEKSVSMAVKNIDEVAPTITSAATAVAIAENSGIGQVVYTATSTDTIDSSPGATTYTLKAGSDSGFAIDGATGAVKLGINPDFETKSSYSFIVVATDATGNASEKTVGLAVKNIDEVAPTITSATTAIATVENSGSGQMVYTVTSTDNGDIAIGASTYSLQAGSDPAFTIDGMTGTVKLGINPDFESKNAYTFTVVATDAAGHSSDKEVSLAITNIDELAPAITSSATATDIAENSGSGQLVYTATSTDIGDIATGTTTYSLKAGSDAGLSIDSATGAVKLGINPDFESKSSYSFAVVATDTAGNASDKLVNLAVRDVNEAPFITSNGGASTVSIAVAENAGAVTTVTATDLDAGATQTYSIVGGSDASKFVIGSSTGVVSFASLPDFEQPMDADANNIYNVVVQVSDGTLSSSQTLAVQATNINEAPVISSNGGGASATVSQPENLTAVTTVIAIDQDAGATPNYSIIGGADAAAFKVDSSTGALSFKTVPDFESPSDVGGNNVYDVVVRASDGTLFDEQAIGVTITNVSEAPLIGGILTQTKTLDTSNVTPFSNVTIKDPNSAAALLGVTVWLDSSTKGTFSTLNGFFSNGSGGYTFNGTAAAAEAAMHGLVFNPADNAAAMGATSTTTLSISVKGATLTTVDSSTTVIATRATGTAATDTVTLPFEVTTGKVDLLAGTDKLSLSSAGDNILIVQNAETIIGGKLQDSVTLETALTGGIVDLGGGMDSLTLSSLGNNILTVVNTETLTGNTSNDTVTLGGAVSGMLVDLKGGIDSVTLSSASSNTLTIKNVETLIGGFLGDMVWLGTPQGAGNFDLGGGDDTLVVALATSTAGWGTFVGGANVNNDLSVVPNRGDSFAFNGALDLTLVPNTGASSMTGIETLSMLDLLGGAGNDSLKLNFADIMALGTGTFDPTGTLGLKDAVRIDGDSGDMVNLSGTGWSLQVPIVGSNTPSGYGLYFHTTSGQEDAYALIQQGIAVKLG